MYAVGIDVSKGNSIVTVVKPFGEIVQQPYAVNHTANELKKLASDLKRLDGETRIVMEHTGKYYEPVAQILYEVGLYVCVINPLLIKTYGNNSVRKIKTDKKDALKIARYALENRADLRAYSPVEETRHSLKSVCRQYNLHMKIKTALKNNLIALLDQSYPNVNNLFASPARSDGHQKWVDFAARFWHCECVRTLTENTLTGLYKKWCKKYGYNFSVEKTAKIHAVSCNCCPVIPKNKQQNY